MANTTPARVEPDWEAVLKIVRASHTQTANKKAELL